MPGTLPHLATGNEKKMDNPAYVKGLILPDYLKMGFMQTRQDYENFFRGCDRSDIISFDWIEKMNRSSHFMDDSSRTDAPVLLRFLYMNGHGDGIDVTIPAVDAYFTHLIGDRECYNTRPAVDVTRLYRDLRINREKTKDILHGDNSFTNRIVEDEFHVMRYVTPDMEKLGKIEFVEGRPTYQTPEALIEWVYRVRALTQDMSKKTILEYCKTGYNRNAREGER